MNEILWPLLCGLFCTGVVIAAVVGSAVLLAVNQKRVKQKAAVQSNWISVTGRVSAARVEETVRTRPDDDAFFYPLIEFEYRVGEKYYNGRQAVGRPFNFERKAKDSLVQYPIGAEIVVTYNPEKPDEARVLK